MQVNQKYHQTFHTTRMTQNTTIVLKEHINRLYQENSNQFSQNRIINQEEYCFRTEQQIVIQVERIQNDGLIDVLSEEKNEKYIKDEQTQRIEKQDDIEVTDLNIGHLRKNFDIGQIEVNLKQTNLQNIEFKAYDQEKENQQQFQFQGSQPTICTSEQSQMTSKQQKVFLATQATQAAQISQDSPLIAQPHQQKSQPQSQQALSQPKQPLTQTIKQQQTSQKKQNQQQLYYRNQTFNKALFQNYYQQFTDTQVLFYNYTMIKNQYDSYITKKTQIKQKQELKFPKILSFRNFQYIKAKDNGDGNDNERANSTRGEFYLSNQKYKSMFKYEGTGGNHYNYYCIKMNIKIKDLALLLAKVYTFYKNYGLNQSKFDKKVKQYMNKNLSYVDNQTKAILDFYFTSLLNRLKKLTTKNPNTPQTSQQAHQCKRCQSSSQSSSNNQHQCTHKQQKTQSQRQSQILQQYIYLSQKHLINQFIQFIENIFLWNYTISCVQYHCHLTNKKLTWQLIKVIIYNKLTNYTPKPPQPSATKQPQTQSQKSNKKQSTQKKYFQFNQQQIQQKYRKYQIEKVISILTMMKQNKYLVIKRLYLYSIEYKNNSDLEQKKKILQGPSAKNINFMFLFENFYAIDKDLELLILEVKYFDQLQKFMHQLIHDITVEKTIFLEIVPPLVIKMIELMLLNLISYLNAKIIRQIQHRSGYIHRNIFLKLLESKSTTVKKAKTYQQIKKLKLKLFFKQYNENQRLMNTNDASIDQFFKICEKHDPTIQLLAQEHNKQLQKQSYFYFKSEITKKLASQQQNPFSNPPQQSSKQQQPVVSPASSMLPSPPQQPIPPRTFSYQSQLQYLEYQYNQNRYQCQQYQYSNNTPFYFYQQLLTLMSKQYLNTQILQEVFYKLSTKHVNNGYFLNFNDYINPNKEETTTGKKTAVVKRNIVVKKGKATSGGTTKSKSTAESQLRTLKFQNDFNMAVIQFKKIFNMVVSIPFYSFQQIKSAQHKKFNKNHSKSCPKPNQKSTSTTTKCTCEFTLTVQQLLKNLNTLYLQNQLRLCKSNICQMAQKLQFKTSKNENQISPQTLHEQKIRAKLRNVLDRYLPYSVLLVSFYYPFRYISEKFYDYKEYVECLKSKPFDGFIRWQIKVREQNKSRKKQLKQTLPTETSQQKQSTSLSTKSTTPSGKQQPSPPLLQKTSSSQQFSSRKHSTLPSDPLNKNPCCLCKHGQQNWSIQQSFSQSQSQSQFSQQQQNLQQLSQQQQKPLMIKQLHAKRNTIFNQTTTYLIQQIKIHQNQLIDLVL